MTGISASGSRRSLGACGSGEQRAGQSHAEIINEKAIHQHGLRERRPARGRQRQDHQVHHGVRDHAVLTYPVWCRPCLLRECPLDHRCIRGVGVDAVLAEAQRSL